VAVKESITFGRCAVTKTNATEQIEPHAFAEAVIDVGKA
jgi:hypothetical protein